LKKKAKEKKKEEKTEKGHAAVLGLRRHTLEGVMIDFEMHACNNRLAVCVGVKF